MTYNGAPGRTRTCDPRFGSAGVEPSVGIWIPLYNCQLQANRAIGETLQRAPQEGRLIFCRSLAGLWTVCSRP